MKRRLMQILAFALCMSLFLTCQVLADNTEDGVMPLWDNVGGIFCEILYREDGLGILRGSVSSRFEGTEIYARLTLYRTHWLLGDTLLNYWTAAGYDAVDFTETFWPEDEQKYKLVLEVTTIYNGHEETLTFTDVETYQESP